MLAGVVAHVGPQFGEDATHRLHHDKVQLVRVDLGVVTQCRTCHVLRLREGLHPREAAADKDKGEEASAQSRIIRCGRAGDATEDLIAQVDRFLNVLEADGEFFEPGDGQRAGNGAERDDDLVVGDGEVISKVGGGVDSAGSVIDRRDARLKDLDVLQFLAQRDHGVARLNGASRRLGQERLVRHVRAPVEHRDVDKALGLALERESGVEAYVATADDEDASACHEVYLLRRSTPWAAHLFPLVASRHGGDVEQRVELLRRHLAALHEPERLDRLTHRESVRNRVLGDLRRVLVTDDAVERRDDARARFRIEARLVHVGGDAHHGLVREHAGGVGEEAHRLENAERHDGDLHIEFKGT